MDVGAEGGDEEPALGLFQGGLQPFAAHGLRRGPSRATHVRGIRHQQAHTPIAQGPEALQARKTAVQRFRVQLEIPRMHQHPLRRVQGQGAGVGDAMRDGNPFGLDLPVTDLHPAVVPHRAQQAGIQAMLAELAFHQPQGEGRSVHGHRPAAQEVGQRPDVILVAVGEQDGLEPIREGFEVGEVRHDGIDARLIIRRKELAAIHKEEAAGAVHDQRVHAELPQASDGDEPQLVGGGSFGPGFEFGH